MRPYEVMIIFDPALEEPVLQAQLDRYSEIVQSRGATVDRVERWGRRRLAYEIQHHRDGYYVVMEAMSEPPAMADLERALFLADEVLRHKVIRIPDRVAGRPRSSPPPAPDEGPERPDRAGGPGPERPDRARASASAPSPPPGGEMGAPGDTVAAGEAAADTSMSANGA